LFFSLRCKKIKQEKPDIPIVFGGANCEGVMGRSLLKQFSQVDHVCSGDGDICFLEFVDKFLKGKKIKKIKKINGILHRQSTELEQHLTLPVMHMKYLPSPDFDDYFGTLEQVK